ncbi:hypothetical protein D4764_02G0005120 [Takifugu flavidus]|uniref:Uncharacterized protein n=1 Tax=Takifugu flavidus TaxID=433684 RepID=A0A5C6NLE5_9TELE|nr:hypothetical protein D4764_02G0005120 [Takifugu flavidus]
MAFGFILTGLEKLVELEFECPCNPKWNGLFSSGFFIIPAIMAFILMLIIQGCRCDEWFKKTVSSSVPAIVWLILLFFDGQYFTCAMTDWDEKLVELEFECPCNPKWNGLFSSAFFIIPVIMAFILMLIIQGHRWCEWFKKTVSSSVPAIVWLILLFFDGQYFTCAKTDWKGRFVLIDKAAPKKWCEPISEGNFTTQELMLRSQEWIFKSQVS